MRNRGKAGQWPSAYRNQDVALLDRLLHERFELIDAEGRRSSKRDELDYVASNRWDPGEFEYRIERLDIFEGRFAIVAERHTKRMCSGAKMIDSSHTVPRSGSSM